jgi:hypothetical protein
MLGAGGFVKEEEQLREHLLTLHDLFAFESDEQSVLARLRSWVTEYLCKPHQHLGRKGSVCPFVPRAIRRQTLRFAVVRLSPSDRARHIEEAVLRYKDVFFGLFDGAGEDRIYFSLLMVFPDVWPEETASLIDRTQKRLKPYFVRQGLMLGEFHSRNEAPGLHNPEFRPQQSPVPMLVIRHMVPGDIVFLNKDIDPASDRVEFLSAYLKTQTSLTPKERAYAEGALKAAQEEDGEDTIREGQPRPT